MDLLLRKYSGFSIEKNPSDMGFFPRGSAGKESACSVGDLGSISGLGRSPGEGKGYPLQYSGLENSINCIVHGVTKSQIWLRKFHFHCSIPCHHIFSSHQLYQAGGSILGASLVAQMVKNLPATQETWVQFLGWEDPLEKGMATHCSILAWKILQTEEPGRLRSMGLQRVGYNWATFIFTFFYLVYSPVLVSLSSVS